MERTKPIAEEIVLDGITLTYEDADKPALKDINLTIQRRQSIGIVGPSGAGKSSLVDTLIGLLTPDAGKVLVDGEDIASRNSEWQSRIGYVPQDTYLLDDTLRRNIAFSIDDTPIDNEKIASAVSVARLDDVIRALPDGLDTVLGESGARLSGGQRQRIAIARALYRDPEILIFDEATSALDNESEDEISNALHSLAAEKTIFIIAHRLTTIRDCDRIIFMKNGHIQDSGPFDLLYSRCDGFRNLVDLGDTQSNAEREMT